MTAIPLEDSFSDIVGKAQRGLKLSDDALAQQAGVTKEALAAVKSGEANEAAMRALAGPLGLGAPRLLALARKAYAPKPRS